LDYNSLSLSLVEYLPAVFLSNLVHPKGLHTTQNSLSMTSTLQRLHLFSLLSTHTKVDSYLLPFSSPDWKLRHCAHLSQTYQPLLLTSWRFIELARGHCTVRAFPARPLQAQAVGRLQVAQQLNAAEKWGVPVEEGGLDTAKNRAACWL
ncbi:hypothetical protein GOP47_0018148, partial [Adiantum capillus-veneris]